MNEQDFEKGREYENLSHRVFFHLLLGYSCLVFGLAFLFFSVWDFKTRFYSWLGLWTFGIMSLLIGYSDKKKLKEYK